MAKTYNEVLDSLKSKYANSPEKIASEITNKDNFPIDADLVKRAYEKGKRDAEKFIEIISVKVKGS